MGQQEIFGLLKKYPSVWFTSREIAEKLNAPVAPVIASLKKLRLTDFIEYTTFEEKPFRNRKQFKYKLRKVEDNFE